MNEYCKEVLMHSWGRAPERKALEKRYNASYYQANKNKWVENKQKRQARQTSLSESPSDIVRAPLDLYDTGEFSSYSVEGFKDIFNAGKKFAKGIKSVAIATIHLPRTIKKAVNKVLDTFKDFKVVKLLKKTKEKLDWYESQSRVKNL